jgi:hypothetical protein
MYGVDPRREARLLLMLGTCGMLWLFAALHLRDSVVLLAVTLTVYAWVWFLRRGGVLRLCWLGGVLAALTATFAVLRTEYAFVPLVASVIGLMSMAIEPKAFGRRGRRLVAIVVLLIGAVASWGYFGLALDAAVSGGSTYRELVRDEAGQSSLGAQLVVNQPIPIRAVVGSIYLMVFPIPVWIGFASDSALHLFKSLNAMFFYALLPLLGLAAADLGREPMLRTADRLFVFGMSIAFIAAIALTSLESRHLGSFLVAVFLLALVPDLGDPTVRRRYLRALLATLTIMLAIHATWLVLKLLPGWA